MKVEVFELKAGFSPTGDQPQAIKKLVAGVKAGLKNQVLLGVTGSGKTFTMANIIKHLQMPALVISHNKTLAGQLYQEMRDFFPKNAVSYFVSYYDYYQPEAYIPTTDTYIEKEAQINELIDKLRLQATANIMSRKDVVVVASVSCIYNIGSPVEWGRFILDVKAGGKSDQAKIIARLVQLQYERREFEFTRGTFRVRGENLDLYPAYEDAAYRIKLKDGKVEKILKFEPVSGRTLETVPHLLIYPAKHYLTDPQTFAQVEGQIRADLKMEYRTLKKQGKLVEAQRLLRRVNYDLEMIREVGYVNGIENYSRYFDGRKTGEPPYTLLDYFQSSYGDRFLVFIDESHMSLPQLRGMLNGDHSRKRTLIEFGFRLKAAFDNRPLTFPEFYKIPPHLIYVSATPDEWEIKKSQEEVGRKRFTPHGGVVDQLVRPTGIADPQVIVRPARNEVQDLICEIKRRVEKKQRVLVTTLTKRTAEDLADYLSERQIKVAYLHSDIETLERSDILDHLRLGKFDVLIGVNLLREGLDLPEVALVAVLDADREGFLRSKTSLIQTMGRAARNVAGQVILYADTITRSIKQAITEIERRRKFQLEYNKKHRITPQTIIKPIREKIIVAKEDILHIEKPKGAYTEDFLEAIKPEALTPYDKKKLIGRLEGEMRHQANDLNFELAIKIRDKVRELKSA